MKTGRSLAEIPQQTFLTHLAGIQQTWYPENVGITRYILVDIYIYLSRATTRELKKLTRISSSEHSFASRAVHADSGDCFHSTTISRDRLRGAQ